MKILTLFLALITLTLGGTAQAAPVGFLGDLNIGDASSFTNSSSGYKQGHALGTIPAQSSITFTYNFVSSPSFGGLVSSGLYSELKGDNLFNYASFSDGTNMLTVKKKGQPTTSLLSLSEMPIQATANQISFTTTITNFASAAAGFTTAFVGFLDKGNSLTNVDYVVSAVPVPAALPLFGLALAGFAGYSRRKNKKAA